MPEKRVVIDVGHGFDDTRLDQLNFADPGAVTIVGHHDVTEFELNMISAIACQTALWGNCHSASFVPFGLSLSDRGNLAVDADVFLSIHHNASIKGKAQGAEVCVHAALATPADEALAARLSKTMAQALGIPDRGIVRMNLAVLRSARKTNARAAILTEAFFLDAAGAEARSWARRSGLAIASEIHRWLEEGN